MSSINSTTNWNNNYKKSARQHWTYLRKDLLDKFLTENDYRYVICAWGERDIHFENHDVTMGFRKQHDIDNFQVFKNIFNYKV